MPRRGSSSRRDPALGRSSWVIVMVDKYNRSIERTKPFEATLARARAAVGALVARKMRSDSLVYGGYLAKEGS